MVFSIRQNSTLPILKMKVYRDGRNDFRHYEELIENCAATFAMKDEKTGIYKVANKAATVALENPCDENGYKHYIITYQFTKEDTNKPGIFLGEFKLVLFDQADPTSVFGELIVPIQEELYIHVLDSFVKSDII
jgi:hypothetical protein